MNTDAVSADYVDFLVIGSGIAGLTFALQTAQRHSTLILTKKDRAESNTNYAQGGVAAVLSDDDSFTLHIEDTLRAGAGLCHEDAVDLLVHEGKERVEDLIRLGAQFSTETDWDGRTHLSLGREGGHSRNRIVHAVDRTGWECERALLAATRDLKNLSILEHFFVIDLAMCEVEGTTRCTGAYALDTATGEIRLFRAGAVLLATGGCGQVYLHTTNPAIATGDGVAMAWNAGAAIANMEFIQFHPTSLYHPEGHSFLISEAVRGEGGILRASDGSTFMENYHPMGALAPRDIVARAIHAERLKRGDPCVYLDVTHLDREFLKNRFPTIFDRCLSLGIDISREPIPVVPAAHYACGGVQTDLQGRTCIPGLYAAGEVTCTGVHGANRLASNSLLEAMVFGYRAAKDALANLSAANETRPDVAAPSDALAYGEEPAPHSEIRHLQTALKSCMTDNAGIVRNDRDLAKAEEIVEEIQRQTDALLHRCVPDADLIELRNMALVSRLIIRSARLRKESRGLHYSTDYPERDDVHWRRDTVLSR